MQEDHNYDGFAAAACLCLIHMQQRGWICSSESGPMQSSGTALWAHRLRQPCEDAAKGLVEGIEPTAEFVAKKDELCKPCVLGRARAHAVPHF
jgi:hypothetical protein